MRKGWSKLLLNESCCEIMPSVCAGEAVNAVELGTYERIQMELNRIYRENNCLENRMKY